MAARSGGPAGRARKTSPMTGEASQRKSDRVSFDLPIEVSGADTTGSIFSERGRTLVVARDGAKIQIPRKLVPRQQVAVSCLKMRTEAAARVVAALGEGEAGHLYGISFVQAQPEMWGIKFPSLSGSERAVGRTVLECSQCHAPEVVHLDFIELEVLEVDGCIPRVCNRCGRTSIWRKPLQEAPAVAVHFEERRQEPRREARVRACVRSRESGEDVVATRDASSRGLSFASGKQYRPGQGVEVALPYSAAGGNVFQPARIVGGVYGALEGASIWGVAYRR